MANTYYSAPQNLDRNYLIAKLFLIGLEKTFPLLSPRAKAWRSPNRKGYPFKRRRLPRTSSKPSQRRRERRRLPRRAYALLAMTGKKDPRDDREKNPHNDKKSPRKDRYQMYATYSKILLTLSCCKIENIMLK